MRNVFSFGDDQGWRIRVRCISIKDRSQFQLSNILGDEFHKQNVRMATFCAQRNPHFAMTT